MRRASRQKLLRGAVLAALAVGGFFLLRGFDWAHLRRFLAAASPWPLLLGAAVNFGNLLCKSLAWHVLLGPAFLVRPLRLFRYAIATAAVSMVAPMRAGEVVRIWLLKSRDGVPVTDAMAVALTEKIFDVAAMMLLVAPLPWLLPGLPTWVGQTVAVLCGASVLGAGAWLVAARLLGSDVPARFQGAVRVLKQPWPRLWGALGLLLMAWIIDWGVVMLVMRALGLQLPVMAGIFVLLCLNVAIAMPSTPAQVGAFELGAVAGLHVLGVPDEQSLAFAVLYHAIQILPLLSAALADSHFVLSARREIAATGCAPAPEV